jgi:hypothetical protein
MNPRFIRLAETDRTPVHFVLDGKTADALQGDTLLVAILRNSRHLRQSEFGGGQRAGFCLMGACQDCWVLNGEGRRLRACTTTVEPGMQVLTHPAEEA